jgi:hypothetical protein
MSAMLGLMLVASAVVVLLAVAAAGSPGALGGTLSILIGVLVVLAVLLV